MARRRERSRLHLRPEAAEKLRAHLWPVQTPSLPHLSSPIFSLKRQQLASNNCELRSWGCIATHGHITSGIAGREGTGGLQSSSPLALRGSCPCRGHHGRIVALLPETSASRDAVRVSPSPTSYSRSAVPGLPCHARSPCRATIIANKQLQELSSCHPAAHCALCIEQQPSKSVHERGGKGVGQRAKVPMAMAAPSWRPSCTGPI